MSSFKEPLWLICIAEEELRYGLGFRAHSCSWKLELESESDSESESERGSVNKPLELKGSCLTR